MKCEDAHLAPHGLQSLLKDLSQCLLAVHRDRSLDQKDQASTKNSGKF